MLLEVGFLSAMALGLWGRFSKAGAELRGEDSTDSSTIITMWLSLLVVAVDLVTAF